MPLPSGLAKQIGFANEAVFGTFVPPTIFVPLVEESLSREDGRLESAGTIAGAQLIRSDQWEPGAITVGGDIGLELYRQQLYLLLLHMFGAVDTTGAGPYTHVFTLGDLTGQSLSVQVGKPSTAGVVRPYSYAGCKFGSWEVGLETDAIATLGLTVVGRSESRVPALAAASFPAGAGSTFHFIHATPTLDGDGVCIRSMTIAGERNLADDRRCIGQAELDEPLQVGRTEVTGSITMEFSSEEMYDRYLNGEEFPIALDFDAGPNAQLTFDMNVRLDGTTPQTSGEELVIVDYPYKVIGTEADGDEGGITATLVDSYAGPA